MKVKCQHPRKPDVRSKEFYEVQFKESVPFVTNTRGVLIHRVRRVGVYVSHGKVSHNYVHYWCGGQSTGNTETEQNLKFYEDPPKDRLLCERCEKIAVKNKELPADKLAGRHVHLGRLVPRQVCCKNDNN